jgi:hypothetical protein
VAARLAASQEGLNSVSVCVCVCVCLVCSVQNLLYFFLICENVKIKINGTVILPAVLCCNRMLLAFRLVAIPTELTPGRTE